MQRLLRQSRAGRKDGERYELLQVASGGMVFTTIQKFMPDEKVGGGAPFRSAEHHRDCRRGPPQPVRPCGRVCPAYGDALPNASFIGFTGTPIEKMTPIRGRFSATTCQHL